MSFPRYPSYKPSGVECLGKVPTDWRVTPLKTVAQVINGYPFDSKLFDPSIGFPLVRIRDLNQSSPDTRYKGEFVESASIDNDDVLIGMDGDFNVGRWLGETPALLNQRMCCVRAETPMITRYLQYALPAPLDTINKLTYATTVKHLSSYDVLRIRLAIPPCASETSAIVTFLDRETAKIDALIGEQQRLIELLQEKRQAVISHAVTKGLNPNASMKDSGVEWLAEVPEHWELLQLKRLSRPGSSITYGIVQAGPHIEDGIPYIRTSDMAGNSLSVETCQRTSHEIDRSYTRSKVNTGDLVVAIRATVGKVLVVPEELDGANLTQGTAKFSPGNKVLTDFIKLSFESRYLQAQIEASSKGATFAEITLDALRRLVFAVPPISEQAEIASRVNALVNQFEGLISDSQRSAALLQERRSALISAAVTGQIDVRGLVPEANAA